MHCEARMKGQCPGLSHPVCSAAPPSALTHLQQALACIVKQTRADDRNARQHSRKLERVVQVLPCARMSTPGCREESGKCDALEQAPRQSTPRASWDQCCTLEVPLLSRRISRPVLVPVSPCRLGSSGRASLGVRIAAIGLTPLSASRVGCLGGCRPPPAGPTGHGVYHRGASGSC